MNIFNAIGQKEGFRVESSKPVNRGDINEGYVLTTDNGLLFVKIHAADKQGMFIKEMDGLTALSSSGTLKVPRVLGCGEIENSQYLLLEWLVQKPPSNDFWCSFAHGISGMHRHTKDYFGWHTNNYIGSLVQSNTPCHSWAQFYCMQRLLPMVSPLYDRKMLDVGDIHAAEHLYKRLSDIFPNEPPALLHGDLWSGNFLSVAGNGKASNAVAAVFDPAVYYGHREMDIGMSLLFGGFNNQFYECYHEHYPLEKNWKQRISITQLYPLLVHAALFGGSYISRCKSILTQWR